MKIGKGLFTLSLILAVTLFTAPHGWSQLFKYGGEEPPRAGSRGPVITHYFAVDKGYYGHIWKIYLEAEDPDGDMLRIAAVVDQPGVGHYQTFWTVVKPQFQKHFKGYLQWNTFSSKTSYMPEWTEITLKISILDKAGNWSNEVVFPFTFETGVSNRYVSNLPPPFDQGDLPRLGHIGIELYSPYSMGDGAMRD